MYVTFLGTPMLGLLKMEKVGEDEWRFHSSMEDWYRRRGISLSISGSFDEPESIKIRLTEKDTGQWVEMPLYLEGEF